MRRLRAAFLMVEHLLAPDHERETSISTTQPQGAIALDVLIADMLTKRTLSCM